MGRIDIEGFSGKNISRIFIAASIREAECVEEILSREGIEYALEIEAYFKTGLLTGSELNGVAFYTLSTQAPYCRNLLELEGLSSGVTAEES